MRPIIILLTAVFALRAADRPRIPADLDRLIDLSHSAPPEFAADALLRIVESGRVADRDTRRDLVEQAFELATRAQIPFRRVPLPRGAVDTRAGYRGRSMQLG
ncbi:MAG: hypothetical protein ACREH9_07190, partial [Pseudomonadota bacterium]